jgi:hypothetical protein
VESGNGKKRIKDQYGQNNDDGDKQGSQRKYSIKEMDVWTLW